MYTLLETWTKRIISMYFLVLKIFPTRIEFWNYARLTVTVRTVVSFRGVKRIELARETEIHWGAEPSRKLPGSSNSIFAIPSVVLRRVSLSLDTMELKRVEIFEQRKISICDALKRPV